MAKSKRHLHKYHKVLVAYVKVWACGLPDCLHYLPQHMEEMAVGKQSICWGCGNRLILTVENMKSDKPMCDACKGDNPITETSLSEIEKAFLESGNI